MANGGLKDINSSYLLAGCCAQRSKALRVTMEELTWLLVFCILVHVVWTKTAQNVGRLSSSPSMPLLQHSVPQSTSRCVVGGSDERGDGDLK